MINPDEIAQLARDLGTPTASEVRIRCGVSRAYYASYHYCLSIAKLHCNPLPEAEKKGKGEHSQLYHQMLKFCKTSTLEQDVKIMAEEAKKLRDFRSDSDYDLTKTVDLKIHGRCLHIMGQVKLCLEKINVSSSKLE